ncbi:transposase [Rhodoplanes elegans]|uniref:Transposase n=1 Tax=Rhodoplanes elegans TaxID=29408 RepID=A0A327K7D9_9BRAD|nr:ATP-binding protein [Rhodoplanes elegans]MBK5960811.1 transposase [Rhodoplanes elegans]RAI33683.1 transposase [Rhodoplanes elegans]
MSSTATGVKGHVSGQVPLKNVAAFMALVTTLIERQPHLPNMGVCHGPSGYGKTYASIFAQNKTRAVRVEVGESWTRKTLVKSMLFELGVQARGTIADMADQVKALLGEDPSRPLIVDEADKLVDKGMIELVREIGEVASCPVILIGEERLPAKLAQHERVHNRVLDWMPALPCDLDDTAALAAAFCPRVTITPDLLDEIRKQSDGRARRIVVNLARVTELARNRGLTTIDRAAWGGTAFFTSKAPTPRTADAMRRSA